MLGGELSVRLADQDLILGDLPDFDITDYSGIADKMNKIKPEIIINAAAFTHVDSCETQVGLCNKINGDAVRNLALLASDNNAIIVHFSTDYVFGGQSKNGYKENDSPCPLNAYGRSKLLGEENLQKYCSQYYLIRTSWLFGHYGPNFVDNVLKMLENQQQIKMVNDQFGNPTYTADLADSIKHLLFSKPEFGIYHRTNEGTVSWYDFTLKIKEFKGLKADVVPISSYNSSRPAKRPVNSKLINTKLPPLRHWHDALKDYLKK